MRQVFPGVLPPSIDFQAVKDGRRSRPFYVSIALDVARSIANGVTEDLTDTSGKALILNAAGNSLFSDPIYDAAGVYVAGVIVAHFQDDALGSGVSTPITLLPNSAERITFTKVIFENFAQVGKVARIVYGVDIDFVPGFNSQTTIAGAVTIGTWLGKNRTFSPGFFGALNGTVPGAGVYRVNQLWNPGPNTVYVDSLEVRSGTVNEVQVRAATVQLPNPSGASGSKRLGAAAPTALLRVDAPAAPAGTIISAIWTTTANVPRILQFEEPIVIPPGNGLSLNLNAPNTDLQTVFEWREG